MSFWQDVKERGLSPNIKCEDDYTATYIKNATCLKKWLLENENPIYQLSQIKEAHKILFQDIAPWAGEFSHRQQIIGGRPGSPPDMRAQEFQLLEEQMKKLEDQNTNHATALRIAAFQHARLLCIHAFHDGNGRLSRSILFDRLEKHIGSEKNEFNGKKEYMDSLRTTIDTEDLIPLTNFFSKVWIGKLDPCKTLKSPFRITALQVEPWKKTWEEETTRMAAKEIAAIPQKRSEPESPEMA